ncbi:MAG: glycosyltransferase [Bacteroidales bacterium]|nr:glycosyltransferase [Bacteroidales bacterium]
MIKNHDFIITGLQPWETTIGSNAKDIALEISRFNRVLYVNTPLDIRTYLQGEDSADFRHRAKVYKDKKYQLRQIKNNLWVADLPILLFPVNGIPFLSFFRWANFMNNKKIYTALKPIISELNFKDSILFIDNDIYRSFHAKEMLNPKYSIYYRRDNLLDVDYWKKYGSFLEPRLAAKSDLVLGNSEYLTDSVKTYNSKSFNVGQGVNLSAFNISEKRETPENLLNIKRPIIGYVGALTSLRLDIPLLIQTAKRLSQYSFVLVGKEDDNFRNSELHKLSNVFFEGEQPEKMMPDYIAAFDICINPQLVNAVTTGNYPRKVDEYLALGKRVVATNTPMMHLFRDHVILTSNTEEFIQALKDCVLNPDKDSYYIEKRVLFAQSHSWENSVNEIYHYIETELMQ